MTLLPEWRERWLTELKIEIENGKEIDERIKYLTYWKKKYGQDLPLVGELKKEAEREIQRYEDGMIRNDFLDSLITYIENAR